MAVSLSRRVTRRMIRAILSPLLSWEPLREPVEGYSLILGVPWELRHMLPVNLQFVARQDLSGLDKLFVVFDRTQRPGAEHLIEQVRRSYPQLPIEVLFHADLPGRIVEKVNVSTYYNSMNCVTALRRMRTRHAILHDFDLYPLVPHYFRSIWDCLRKRDLHFCGLEPTDFDGLHVEDNILGTWCLGMDVQWIRNEHHPIEVFQRIKRFPDGRLVQLDPFSYLQTKTTQRALAATVDESDVCHVRNLCGTYIRYRTGRRPDFVWRLHYLWYLESLCGMDQRLGEVINAMSRAASGMLRVGDYETDFSHTHATCANVLRKELTRMEEALFGRCRPEVQEYLDGFESFLSRHGEHTPLDKFEKVRR